MKLYLPLIFKTQQFRIQNNSGGQHLIYPIGGKTTKQTKKALSRILSQFMHLNLVLRTQGFGVFEQESHVTPGQPQTCYVAEAGLKLLLIIVPLPPKCWN